MSIKLSLAIRELDKQADRLVVANTDLKLRNARRAFLDALRTTRRVFDEKYPKPKSKREPSCERASRSRAFNLKTAELFLNIAIAHESIPLHPVLVFHEGSRGPRDVFGTVIKVHPNWSSIKKWAQVVHWVRKFGKIKRADDLFDRFWTELIPVDDLGLAAEHHAFLEKARKRSERAKRAAATRCGKESA